MSGELTIVIGLGATGYSCVRHLAPTAALGVVDTRRSPPFLDAVRRNYPDVAVLDASRWREALAQARRVVVSPGVSLDDPLVSAARAAGVDLTSDIQLFLDAVEDAPVVGVTGTNGKSTVTTLVGELMAAAGVRAGVGGNLGTPALDLLDGDFDIYVLELSSFQLERLDRPGLAVAALLNVSPDHLDRHAGLEDYAASKRRIYAGAGRLVYNAADPRTLPVEPDESRMPAIAFNGEPRWRIDGDELVIDGRRLATTSLGLRGRHNRLNALAAAAIVHQAGVPVDEEALAAFRGLPHRSALVAEIDGVAYIDDSKATNIGACQAALEGFGNGTRNIVLIAGGDAKGARFDALGPHLRRHVSRLVLLGRDADRIAEPVARELPNVRAQDMEQAVRLGRASARPGDTVLLSPACASFDMYADYNARGDDFAAHVRAISGANARRGQFAPRILQAAAKPSPASGTGGAGEVA